ncbi:efflux RND transporter permease subunit [Salipaludibacillus aurantiacus]|uniref:Multidrug efflux pump subunit AcrB n=1 Tax=Salipaludibacillus aurantiacus TaxID=1601833 RepID=A0A1H9XAW1_9BACI|nr:efflux RND transporter permease subunit [Salipaludibacillus aurantiacus]SES43265.1 Multidrug efflux pump subunit AcrB [Salipaludibacillus aurantiacus]
MFDAIIKRPKITMMFIFILVVVGTLTLFQLPQREVPEFSFDIGIINTPYPGGAPEEVEQQVTIPLEEAVENIDGISEMSSVSTSGFSNIVIELEENADRNEVFTEIQQAILRTEGDLPDEAVTPDFSQQVSLGGLSSYHILHEDREELYELKNMLDDWQGEVEALPGVDRTIVKGFPDQYFMIDVDSDELFGSGLQLPDVIQAVEEELNTQPLGVQQIDGQNVQLALSVLEDEEEISSIFVGQDFEGESVYLEDIADVGIMNETPEDLITFEDTPAVSFTVIPGSGVNIPELHDDVDERVMALAQDLPEEMEIDLFYTQKTVVDEIFGDLAFSFALAGLSVVVVTLLGLNWSSAVIVALAIPTSVLIGLIPLPFFNVDLNQISIIGMIIALGILVDDAIVVGDNIRHKYRQNYDPLEGALTGAKEVRASIITSTLTIVFTFLPLVFISGGNGDFIRALPTVLIATILASTIVALSFVPIFLVWRQKKQRRKKNKSRKAPRDGLLGKQLNSLSDWYSDSILKRVVRHPWKVAIIGFVVTTSFYGLIPFIPVVFFPDTDRQEVTVEVRMPAGTTIEDTEETLQQMREFVLAEDEHIFETAVYTGEGLPPLFGDGISNSSEETGNLLLRTNREEQSAQETISRWTEPLQDEFSEAEVELTTIESGPPVGAPVAITLQGPEVETLIDMSNELQERIAELPESGTVLDDMGPLRPTVVYEPVREEMEANGITMSQISEQIGLRTDGIPLMTFRTDQDAIDLQLTLDRVEEDGELDLSDIEVPSQAEEEGEGQGGPPELIALDTLLEETESEEIPQVLREDGVRTITVRVFPANDNDEVLESEIEAITDDVRESVSEDYTVSLGGETEARTDFILELFTLFLVVLFLIYIVMAIQFYSLTIPILVMSTVHIASAGAVVGLFLTQTGLGFMALMGIVSLAGIVVRNSIVLLEFIKQRRADGMSIEDAVVEAGRVRLRPILLTAFTAIGALTPVALSGDVLFVPLAISIISGLLFSAVLTVVIVPAVYTAFAVKFGK